MRLLFVISEYLPDSGGGIITFYRHLLPELVRQGHCVHALVADGTYIGESERIIEGVRVTFIDRATHGKYLRQFARYRLTMPWLAANLALAWAAWECAGSLGGFDHVETTDWPLLFVPWIVHREQAPCTVQLHGSHGQITAQEPGGGDEIENGFVRLLERTILREADALQTNSRLNAGEWKTRLDREIGVEYPAFTFPLETLSRTPSKLSLGGVVFARLNLWKGSVQLAETLAASSDEYVIDWYGSDCLVSAVGMNTTSLLKSRYPHVFGTRLRHRSGLANSEAMSRMSEAAFVLIPSLWDVFNLTCVEAMAVGSLAVCSRRAGAAELIEHGVNGFTYDPLQPAEFFAVIERIQSLSTEEHLTMRRSAAETVRQRLDPRESAERRSEHFRRVAGSSRSPFTDDWLAETVSPSSALPSTSSILDRCGVRELTGALLRRLRGKIARLPGT